MTQKARATACACVQFTAAGKMAIYKCSKCSASYVTLFELVGHVRAAHSLDLDLELICGVNSCDDIFSSTFSWYRHIRSCHPFEYYHHLADQSETSSVDNELQSSVDSDLYQYVEPPMDVAEDQLSGSEGQVHKSMCVNASDVAAGMIIKLKEGCKLTQKAMSEVVNIADFTCSHVIQQAQGVIEEICERHGLNLESTLVVDIKNSLEQIHSPFAKLETNYRQNSYISQNMPYVVRNILQHACLIKNEL